MPEIGGTMRIVPVSYDPQIRHEVRNDAGTTVMRGEFLWMCTSWCRENSIPYIVCDKPKEDEQEKCYMCRKPITSRKFGGFCSQKCNDDYYEADDPGDTHPDNE